MKQELKNEIRLAVFWILGAVMICFASWILGHLNFVPGTTERSYFLAIVISFILVLFSGLLWIAVSVGVSENIKN